MTYVSSIAYVQKPSPSPAALHATSPRLAAAASGARDVFRRVESLVKHCERLAPDEASLADKAADALKSGGHLYVAGEPGFVAEADGRAGGLMMIRPTGPPAVPPRESVLLYGWRTPETLAADRAWLGSARQAGCLVIGIGPEIPSADAAVFNGTLQGLGPDPAIRKNGETFGDLDAIGNTVNLWNFTGELVAALSRRRLTPSIWQSIWVAGAQARNAPRSGHDYDPLLSIQPIPREQLARQYSEAILRSLRHLEESAPQFALAADQLDEIRAKGGHARLYIMAHMVGLEIRGKDDPRLLDPLPDPITPGAIQPGDAVMAIGYAGIPQDVAKEASAAHAPVTWFVAPTPGMQIPDPARDRYIYAQWILGDAAVRLPGYDVGALPPSGVLQLSAYWAVTAAMLAVDTTAAHVTENPAP